MASYVNLQGITVPNPDALKFEIDDFNVGENSYEFDSIESAAQSPLALKLFRLGYVNRVFISQNFITVNKVAENSPGWQEAQGDIRIMIKRHLELGEPVLSENAKPVQANIPSNEKEQMLKDLLEDIIRPATLTDGGVMVFDSFENGVLKVKLHGACFGCPFAPRTIKSGIEVIAQKEFPWVTEVTSDDVVWEETQEA